MRRPLCFASGAHFHSCLFGLCGSINSRWHHERNFGIDALVSGTGADDLCRDVGRSLLSIVQARSEFANFVRPTIRGLGHARIVFPSISRPIIENLVSIPSGADIQMTQREAVNDAWDLPKEATMDAFVGRHLNGQAIPLWNALSNGSGTSLFNRWGIKLQNRCRRPTLRGGCNVIS